MAKAAKKKKKKSKAPKLNAAEKHQLRIKRTHFREVRAIFATCGFKRVTGASDKEFTYNGTTSDLDDVFVYENVIVLSECTVLKSGELSGHLKKKKVLYDKLIEDVPAFLNFLANTFPDFQKVTRSTSRITIAL
ncbi:hypothetical protein [Bradyrhizobium sp. NC92]|uniref:hypothetical protein n=1 Tax=Bradyrhizobium sp. (strain NC92) TaxID=55395 RepID=UPI0021A9932A|nr:hypothetical protein [Bradyrhizobium sp. NC92]UWU70341.1 hypothetical protein N2602_07350 [Bradyrhizobium sp. NC92]